MERERDRFNGRLYITYGKKTLQYKIAYKKIDERPIKGMLFEGSRIDFVYKYASEQDDFGYIWELWRIFTIDGRAWIRAFNTGETIDE